MADPLTIGMMAASNARCWPASGRCNATNAANYSAAQAEFQAAAQSRAASPAQCRRELRKSRIIQGNALAAAGVLVVG